MFNKLPNQPALIEYTDCTLYFQAHLFTIKNYGNVRNTQNVTWVILN